MNLYLAGRCRGKFEVILIFDTLKLWKGENYSRFQFTSRSKDTNNDGKVSYWERTFPKDGGHRIKLREVIYISIAVVQVCMLSIVISFWPFFLSNNWFFLLGPFIAGIASFAIYSLGFLDAFQTYRKPPPDGYIIP